MTEKRGSKPSGVEMQISNMCLASVYLRKERRLDEKSDKRSVRAITSPILCLILHLSLPSSSARFCSRSMFPETAFLLACTNVMPCKKTWMFFGVSPHRLCAPRLPALRHYLLSALSDSKGEYVRPFTTLIVCRASLAYV